MSHTFRDAISAVLPAYNEEATIETAIVELSLALRESGRAFEIIVVDDGSTDATSESVERIQRADSQIRLVRLAKNTGYGGALRSGFAAARYPLVFQTDADSQFVASEIFRLLEKIETADVVCGYRIRRQDPPHRLFLSWGYNWFVKSVFAVPVRDTDCAFKLFRRDVLQQVALQSNRYFVTAELLAKLHFLGKRIVEVGVTHRPRVAGESKVRLGCICDTLFEAGRVFFRPTFVTEPAQPAVIPASRPGLFAMSAETNL